VGFEFIAKFFENSMLELVARHPGLDQTFRRIDANRFTAAIYLNGQKICRGSASIGGGLMGSFLSFIPSKAETRMAASDCMCGSRCE
jgi:hypothetical protein